MTLGLTLPIIAIGVMAAKAAIDFESAFAGVRKTVDATEEQFSQLSDEIRGLALELPITASELARVGEVAGQLGVQADDLSKFIETAAKLGIATTLSAEEAALGLARFSNIMQIPLDKVEELGNVLVELGNNFAANEGEILGFSLRLGGAANAVGITAEQVLGLSAALAAIGVREQAGGTAFSRVFINIQDAVSKSGDQLHNFAQVAGTTSERFAQLWRDKPMKALNTFIVGLGNLQRSGIDILPILEAMELDEIRLRDALLRAASASSEFTRAQRSAADAIRDGNALTVETDKRLATVAAQLDILKNSITETFIDLLLGSLPDINTEIKNLSTAISEMSDESRNNILKVVAVLGLGGPLLIATGAAIGAVANLAKAFVAMGIFAIKALGKVIIALNAVGVRVLAIVGALGLAITAGAALGAGVSFILEEKLGIGGGQKRSIEERLAANAGVARTERSFDEFFADKMAQLGGVFGGVPDIFGDIGDSGVGELLGDLTSGIGDVFDILGNFGAGPGGAVSGDTFLTSLGEEADAAAAATANLEKNSFKTMFALLNEAEMAQRAEVDIKGLGDAAGAGGAASQIDELGAAIDALPFVNPVLISLAGRMRGLEEAARGVKDAMRANQAATRQANDELREMQKVLTGLNRELSDANSKLNDLASPRLTGQGAHEDKLFGIDQALRQARLAELTGVGGPTGEFAGMSEEELRELRDITQLKRSIETEPLLRRIEKLAKPDESEISATEAIRQIGETQARIAALTIEIGAQEAAIEGQRSAIAALQAEGRALAEQMDNINRAMALLRQATDNVSKALQIAIKWFGGEREELIKTGKISEEEAKRVDSFVTQMLTQTTGFMGDVTQGALDRLNDLMEAYESARHRLAQGLNIPVVGGDDGGGGGDGGSGSGKAVPTETETTDDKTVIKGDNSFSVVNAAPAAPVVIQVGAFVGTDADAQTFAALLHTHIQRERDF